MNTVTIYDLSGNVLREVEFKKIEPGIYKHCRIFTADGSRVIQTNLPVVATGDSCYMSAREPTLQEREQSETFDITMVLGQPGGRMTHEWKKACWLLQSDGCIWFWHNDRMVFISGPVLIESFCKGY